jgi:GT2 family glycosyltransferase
MIKYITIVNNFDTLSRALFESCGVNSDNIAIIDNTIINNPISYGYNITIKNLLKDTKSEWLAFCHQDFYMVEDLSLRLHELDKNCIYGPIGVSSKGMFGKIVQKNDEPLGNMCDKCTVETLDAMCMIVHKDTIRKYNLSFDENFKYHFYVEDFCLQARKKGILTKILQMDCQHRSRTLSGDLLSQEFKNSQTILIRKWQVARTTTGFHGLCQEEFDIEQLVKTLEMIRFSN